jgi:hypothetical protein
VRCAAPLLLVLVLAVGCSAERSFVGLPTDATRGTELLLVHGTSGVEAYVLDLAQADLRVLGARTGDTSLRLEALIYAATPAELGLSPGSLALAEVGAGGAPLPTPDAVFETRLGPDGAEAWGSRSGLSDEAAALRTPVARWRCPEHLIEPVRLPEVRDELNWGVWDGADGVLFRLGGELYRLTTSATFAVVRADLDLAAVGGATNLADGSILLGGRRGGELWRGRWTGTRLEVEALPSRGGPGFLSRLGAGLGPSGLEVFTVDNAGTVARWREGVWTTLGRMPPGPSNHEQRDAIWLGPDHALFAWGPDRNAWRWRDGVLAPEPLPDGKGATAGALVPGLGPVLSIGNGTSAYHDGRQWVELAHDGGQWGLAVRPFGEGYVLAGVLGHTVAVRNLEEWCPYSAGFNVRALVAVPDRMMVLLGDSSQLQTGAAGIMRPLRP